MTRVLIRSGKSPFAVLSPEASLARNGWGVFGANVGNLLFMSSVHRAVSVPGVEVVSNSLLTELPGVDKKYIERINSEFDSFVVPLANAFRPSFLSSLSRLTDVIKQLTVPVTVVGVGVQLPASAAVSDVSGEVQSATLEFASAVLNRSASIGVRGEVTRRYLRGLGIPDTAIDVIGCPSLFDNGPNLQVEKRTVTLTPASAIAMNITPSVRAMAPIIDANVRTYPNLIYVPQEHHELAMMMWGRKTLSPEDPRIPAHPEHPLFADDRARFFLDASTWVTYMRDVEFAFGTRIHGNIAALMAGTPAVVLTHDSRTLELAEYHCIPHRATTELAEDVHASTLYEEADFSDFNKVHPRRFEVYRDFLNKNGVRNIFTAGNENPSYDAELASTPFPPPVQSIVVRGELCSRSVVDRLRWLRQGSDTDKRRVVDAYRPAFGLTVPERPSVAALQRKCEEQGKRLADVEREARERAAAATALAKQVNSLTSRLAQIEQEQRVTRKQVKTLLESPYRRFKKKLRDVSAHLRKEDQT